MSVSNVKCSSCQLLRPLVGVFLSTVSADSAVATKMDYLDITAVWTDVEKVSSGVVLTVQHLFDFPNLYFSEFITMFEPVDVPVMVVGEDLVRGLT